MAWLANEIRSTNVFIIVSKSIILEIFQKNILENSSPV